MTRKSLARRRPVAVYRVESDDNVLTVKAWLADDEDMRRADTYAGKLSDDEYDGPRIAKWVDTRDTDSLRELPQMAFDLICELDDAIRARLKK